LINPTYMAISPAKGISMSLMRSLMAYRAALAILVLGSAFPVTLRADIVQWKISDGGNGHYYGLIMPDSHDDSYSWTSARTAAESMTYGEMQGYLATVTSLGESEFLREQFSSQLSDDSANAKYAWIGLFAPTTTSDFQWVTGEPLSYTDWAPGEPNFYGSPLWQHVHYWTRDFGSGPTWTWNNEQDFPGRNTYGYFVEFGTAVPEPSTFAMVGLSGALLLAYSAFRRLV
jgi:hypothetical protein